MASDAAGPLTLDSTITRASSALSAEVGSQVVLLIPARNAYFDANDIGSVLWKETHAPKTIRTICDAVLGRYAVERVRGEADVLEFFNLALREGLIEVVASRENCADS
jgi:hypothetical protein